MPLRRSIATTALWAVALLAAWSLAPASSAANDLLTLQAASVGVGGQYKSGYWNPVRLTVAAGPQGAKGELVLVIPDGDRVPVLYADELRGAIDLASGEAATVLLYGKSGPVGVPMRVELRDGGRALWSHELREPLVARARPSTQELIVAAGPPVGIEQAIATIRRPAETSLVAASAASAAELPDRWWGYDGVDVLVLLTSDADFLQALTPEQQTAIVQWVELGGRLVFSVGDRGDEVLAADSPFAPLAPGKLREVSFLRDRAGLESLTRSELPWDEEFFQRNRPRVSRLADVHGEVVVDESGNVGNDPLVIRATVGLGEVVFVGFDLAHPSLASWPGRPRLVAALLTRGTAPQQRLEMEARRTVNYLGYSDLVGQLRTALDQFRGVSMITFTTVAILTVGYLLLVGPGDWLLLNRLGWPRHITWLTFPLIAAGIGVVAWSFGGRSHGTQVRLNQAEIVDIDVERQVARGTVWSHLYSPATTYYDAQLEVALPEGVLAAPGAGWLIWQGLPGDALGGLASQQVVLASTVPYRAITPDPGRKPALEGLPVQIASSKALTATWWVRTKVDAQDRLALDPYGQLRGQFRQPLPVELSDCLMACGEKLYRLGTLRPGQTVTVDPSTSLNLEWRLTERRFEKTRDVATPWRQDSTDVPQIVQMLMFHEAARGRGYTGMMHRYQPELDLSEHIRLGRAVLVGRAADPVAELRHGDEPLVESGQARTWTWYRLVFPVAPRQADPRL
jgi:hypothetical protein